MAISALLGISAAFAHVNGNGFCQSLYADCVTRRLDREAWNGVLGSIRVSDTASSNSPFCFNRLQALQRPWQHIDPDCPEASPSCIVLGTPEAEHPPARLQEHRRGRPPRRLPPSACAAAATPCSVWPDLNGEFRCCIDTQAILGDDRASPARWTSTSRGAHTISATLWHQIGG